MTEVIVKNIVWDIDGTISDSAHRLPLIKSKPKNWKAFMELSVNDDPIRQTQYIFNALAVLPDNRAIIMTARAEEERAITETWLNKNEFERHVLIMRPNGDYRPDWEVKNDLLDKIEAEYGAIFMAFEDRPGVIQNVYHKRKIFVLDVGNGTAS